MTVEIQAIIFDCFGVLVGRGFDETYRMAGGDPSKDRQFIKDMLGQANLGLMSEDEFHGQITNKLGISQATYQQAVTKAEQLNIELLTYIEQLHKTYKTAILSNANIGVVQGRISKDWLERCFDSLIVSAEVNAAKPDSRIYEIVAEKLGVEPQACVFIDDHESYCKAAQSFGMQAILYQDFMQFRTELDKLLKA